MPSSRRAGTAISGTLDLDDLQIAQQRDTFDQTCSGSAEHNPARRSDRFHPLRHTDLLADRGVTKCSRTDFAGNHLAGVQADPQLEIDAVALVNVVGERPDAVLDFQGGKTGTGRVVFERCWCTEHSHDAVAGELVNGPAITRHDRGAAGRQLRHYFAQPLRAH